MNGAQGLAILPQGQLIGALGFTVRDIKIVEIDVISRLRPPPPRLELAAARR